ncbi:MFS transporter [Aliidiomarina shirensis]|uniref:MFS transporter n=1 Tax=Aliidiomarina shirensis TaxID=1048642 RepID=A0A432WQT4_9GAMM|nr:VC0807 family protein [Aliidiomarina shirensis]RUO36089.1 MFS transporter [Aliidiomarina shirensis]
MQEYRNHSSNKAAKEPGLMVNMLFNIFLPVIILMQLSNDARLGAAAALALALAFPFGFGCWELYRRRKINGFSILGLVSVLLTGGIGLLELDPAYIAIKEAAVPAIIGIVVFGSRFTRFPVVEKILLNRKVLDLDKLYAVLAKRGKTQEFQRTLNYGGNAVASAFFLSAVLNYMLARMIVVSPAGTEAFNNEIARMTALSFPVIVLPTMIILMGAIVYIFIRIGKLTGESVENFLQAQD